MNRLLAGKHLVLKAGWIAKKYFRRPIHFSFKKNNNISEVVTPVDLLIEQTVWHSLHKLFPEDTVIGEELGTHTGSSEFTWYIDPIDGTQNFYKKIGFFNTAVALEQNGEVIAGWIYNPLSNDLFFAEKGKGAFLNGKKINPSSQSKFKDAYLFYCDGKCSKKELDLFGIIFKKLRSRVFELRKVASANLEFAYIACGRADVFVCTDLKLVDFKAGLLLLTEAGGKATDWAGKTPGQETRSFVVSNGILHSKIISETKPFAKKLK